LDDLNAVPFATAMGVAVIWIVDRRWSSSSVAEHYYEIKYIVSDWRAVVSMVMSWYFTISNPERRGMFYKGE
jgi:hypothetical protein